MGDVELQAASRFDWERIVRRCLIPGKVKLVAYTLAQYGDKDGRNIRPGFPRLAAVCEMGESTARRHVDALLALGLVERLSHGGGRNRAAAVYRLTVPSDLLERVGMLGPDEVAEQLPVAPELFNSAHVESGVTARYSAHERRNSARRDERSNDGYSAHENTVLRSFEGPTPLTQVSAHQGPPITHQGDRSPQVSTSPARHPPTGDPIPDAETERQRQAAALAAWQAQHPELETA